MNELMAIWADWLRPSAGLPTVQWSLLLAVAAAAGHLLQRYTGLPKVVGYSVIGALAGLGGFTGAVWPLQGIGLFLLELGVSVVLFEAGGRIALRWFRHNPMVLVQSLLECVLTALFVNYALRWMGVQATVAEAVALVAMAASPAVLSRVMMDTHASGPVTERAMVLSTLSTLFALTLVSARAGVMHRGHTSLGEFLFPVAVILGVSFVVAAMLALALRTALRVMSPTSENTSMLLISLLTAATALAAHFGGSAPLAALLGGMMLKQLNPKPWAWPHQLGTASSLLNMLMFVLVSVVAATALAAHFGGSAPLAALLGGLMLKQLNPRPWAWPHQLGTASSLLNMLMFVLVSVVAAKADWNPAVANVVVALVVARGVAKVLGVGAANWGSGTNWRQAFWTGCAMSPMSSVALLLVSQFVASSLTLGPRIASIALPAILLMEVLGAILATFAIYRVGESSMPSVTEAQPYTVPGELRG